MADNEAPSGPHADGLTDAEDAHPDFRLDATGQSQSTHPGAMWGRDEVNDPTRVEDDGSKDREKARGPEVHVHGKQETHDEREEGRPDNERGAGHIGNDPNAMVDERQLVHDEAVEAEDHDNDGPDTLHEKPAGKARPGRRS